MVSWEKVTVPVKCIAVVFFPSNSYLGSHNWMDLWMATATALDGLL